MRLPGAPEEGSGKLTAALVALVAYTFLQVGLYGALRPSAAGQAATYLGVHASPSHNHAHWPI